MLYPKTNYCNIIGLLAIASPVIKALFNLFVDCIQVAIGIFQEYAFKLFTTKSLLFGF